jgi:hypothetical protein
MWHLLNFSLWIQTPRKEKEWSTAAQAYSRYKESNMTSSTFDPSCKTLCTKGQNTICPGYLAPRHRLSQLTLGKCGKSKKMWLELKMAFIIPHWNNFMHVFLTIASTNKPTVPYYKPLRSHTHIWWFHRNKEGSFNVKKLHLLYLEKLWVH